MHSRSLVTIVLLALCAFSAVFASPPPPPATDILSVTSPKRGSAYHVGDTIPLAIKAVNGTEGILYKANPQVEIHIQKDIRFPQLNVLVGTVSAHNLISHGFKFKAKKEYLIKEQATIPFRVRVSFKVPGRFGYADSGAFHIEK